MHEFFPKVPTQIDVQDQWIIVASLWNTNSRNPTLTMPLECNIHYCDGFGPMVKTVNARE